METQNCQVQQTLLIPPDAVARLQMLAQAQSPALPGTASDNRWGGSSLSNPGDVAPQLSADGH